MRLSCSLENNDGIISFYCDGMRQDIGSSCNDLENYYYIIIEGNNNHYKTLEEALDASVNSGYLNANNVRNFICFSSETDIEECSTNDLYRIIGVFDGQVKLIKYDYANFDLLGNDGAYIRTVTNTIYSGKLFDNALVHRYYWNNNTLLNDWSSSFLNTINLNLNYWNHLEKECQNKISDTTWKIGGNTWEKIGLQDVKTTFTNEIASPAETATYSAKIGLIYVSDYMYSVNPNYWVNLGNSYNQIKEWNWMYMGDYEWTISKVYSSTSNVFLLNNSGELNNLDITSYIFGVRPSFYLNSDVEIYEGHAGTASDPYRIVI